MTETYILKNQHQAFLDKSNEWISAGERKQLFRTVHKDEAINMKVEWAVKHPDVRIEIVAVEVDEKGLPLVDLPRPVKVDKQNNEQANINLDSEEKDNATTFIEGELFQGDAQTARQNPNTESVDLNALLASQDSKLEDLLDTTDATDVTNQIEIITASEIAEDFFANENVVKEAKEIAMKDLVAEDAVIEDVVIEKDIILESEQESPNEDKEKHTLQQAPLDA